MTIIQPNKNNKSNPLILIAMATAILSVVWGVFLYNELVDTRHEVQKQTNSVQEAEVKNAELKNNLYNVIDANNLEILAKEQPLILENNPRYIKSTDGKQFTANN